MFLSTDNGTTWDEAGLTEGGIMILLLVLAIVIVLARVAYNGIFPPLLGIDAIYSI